MGFKYSRTWVSHRGDEAVIWCMDCGDTALGRIARFTGNLNVAQLDGIVREHERLYHRHWWQL